MAILSRRPVRRTLVVIAIALALAPLVWAAGLWLERRTARANFDRIKDGMSFKDVMGQMGKYHYSGPNRIRFDWTAIPPNEGFLPLNFGSANAGFMVCFEKRGPKDLRVFY